MSRALVASLLALASTALFAQQSASANANATATILKPITITKSADLAFGNVIFTGAAAGTVQMAVATSGAITVTPDGTNATATYGTQTPATFAITGKKNKTYTIAVAPVNAGNVTLCAASDATKQLTVQNLTFATANGASGTTSGTATLSATRTDTIYVGGTLNIPTTAIEDDYTTASGSGANPLKVTVAYN